ncbi:copper transporter [Limnochorda pilosa]|uniref:Copper transporter n=1 Tax=Limnochorda pilosa TaxID=1555112 RepID=A0A0K2SN33_LIMPI|nr:copper transporter [Limnochorda pilosa]BAS28412.1 hypothetical protein LIP_2582 [Limnochorda pilosa]
MVEWRSHLASLGAVFLALALGMVIGLGLGGDDAWIQRQQAALDRIEDELNASREAQHALLEREARLTQEAAGWRAFGAEVLPLLVKGRLEGRTVGVVTAPDHRAPAGLLEVLRLSGARVVSLPWGRPAAAPDPAARPAPGEDQSPQAAGRGSRGAAEVDALVVVAGTGFQGEGLTPTALLPATAPAAAFPLLALPDRFPDRELPLPDGWAAVGPLDHPVAAVAVVLGLAARRPGRYGWASEGPRLP